MHGGVAVERPPEVVDDPGEEHLVAERGVELLEDAGALGVGDAVEVLERRGRVERAVAGDGVRARSLVGDQAPLAAGVGVVGPGVAELGDVRGDPVAHVLGEGLVEPQVVPPLRCGDVAEPLVRHLVGDGGGPLDAAPAGHLAAEHQRVAEGHAAGVLHGAGVELRHERLVVVAERVADPEQPVELVEALLGRREQLVGVGVEVLGDRLPRREAERDAVVLVGDQVVGPGHERHEVRRQRLGLLELPDSGLDLLAGGVADHGPVRGGGHVQGVRRLEVGLVEAGEDAGRGVHEGHAVDVVPPVGRVHAAVQPLAVVAEAHHRVHDQLVGPGPSYGSGRVRRGAGRCRAPHR